MAFMIFKKEHSPTGICYMNAGQGFKLAGRSGLLYRLWNKMNKPVGCGWSVTADDLLKEHCKDFSTVAYALVIDFHPSAQNRIGLVEIEAVHIYTYGDSDSAFWSPMMLELRDVYYDEDFDEPLTANRKQGLLAQCALSATRQKIVEFLYLQGGWNWGRNGSTNAAFIHDEARKYFQGFFNCD
jgi:hypothetical protein